MATRRFTRFPLSLANLNVRTCTCVHMVSFSFMAECSFILICFVGILSIFVIFEKRGKRLRHYSLILVGLDTLATLSSSSEGKSVSENKKTWKNRNRKLCCATEPDCCKNHSLHQVHACVRGSRECCTVLRTKEQRWPKATKCLLQRNPIKKRGEIIHFKCGKETVISQKVTFRMFGKQIFIKLKNLRKNGTPKKDLSLCVAQFLSSQWTKKKFNKIFRNLSNCMSFNDSLPNYLHLSLLQQVSGTSARHRCSELPEDPWSAWWRYAVSGTVQPNWPTPSCEPERDTKTLQELQTFCACASPTRQLFQEIGNC